LDGPAENPSGITKPYKEYLNAELQKKIDDIKSVVAKAEKDKERADMAAGFCALLVVTPIGLILLPGLIGDQIETRNRIAQLNQDVKKAGREQAEITTLIEKVNLLIHQFENIGAKVDAALSALAELGKLFQAQYRAYHGLAKYLGDLKASAGKYEALRLRKRLVLSDLNKAVSCLKEVSLGQSSCFKSLVLPSLAQRQGIIHVGC
jgi:hypothetical protein